MKVKVSYKDIPDGADVFVHGLPPLSNGAEIELTEDEVAFYKAMTGKSAVALLLLDDVDRPSKHKDDEPSTTPNAITDNPVTNPVEVEKHGPVDEGKKEKG